LGARYSAEVLKGDSPLPVHLSLRNKELDAIVCRAADIVDRPRSEQLGAELWERIHWFSRRSATPGGHTTHVLTRRALQLMRGSPELRLEVLAHRLRAHPSEVSRHFHRDMGITLVRFRMRHRLLHLIDLIDSGERQLMRAAAVAGFGSYSQCHRAFQSELGCAPRQFFSAGLREQMQLTYAG
jgi:AraC-like DNA-binding protein